MEIMTKHLFIIVVVHLISLVFSANALRPGEVASFATEDDNFIESSLTRDNRHRFPVIIDQFDHRRADGSYEFRYELSDGTARYERGYFVLVNRVKTLTVAGYYSYRMSDGRYLTVFYNADHRGYRQNSSISPQPRVNLPRSLEIPESEESILEAQSFPNVISNHLP